ncbi:MAG TPA: N,N-dimethylformamidase beta subunit family domain-containing protein [Tepidisphaeraceae bacterium]|jgi:hypothetical protein
MNRRQSVFTQCMVEPLELRTLFAALTIAQENALPGTPASTWDVAGAGTSSLQGFATDMSVNRGSTINFKIDDSTLASYHIDIYRLGYYQGNGARFITSIGTASTIEKDQPTISPQSGTGLIDCGNWTVSASWTVPADATSGVYIAKLQYDNSSGASHIPFIVRNDGGTSDVIFQTSDTTWQAYNNYGGNSLYEGNGSTGRAYKVSYNRPFNTRSNAPEDYLFNAEYPMIRFLERNGYDVSYISGVDTDRLGAGNLTSHKLYLSVGHDEYWSKNQRANVQAARDAGTNLAFFSGNEMFWKTRWETSATTGGASYRTLVCYKETHAGAKIDPTSEWTGTWRDPRFSPPADGGRPENELIGQIFMVNDGATSAIQVPFTDAKLRLWRNTSIASMTSGTATLAASSLGYEWDSDMDNGFRPAGVIDLSHTTISNAPILTDYGSTFGSGTAKHSLTLYKAASGALVFGAGTVQWPWGLDSNHDRGSNAADSRMQQATVNLFADMGVQASSLMSGIVAASKSADLSGPTVTITSPANGTNVSLGATITVNGTTADSGGGVVAGTEYSIDGGTTWHPTAARTPWTFSFSAVNGGQMTVLVRGIDDSANIGTPATLTFNVQGPIGETIFGNSVPTTQDPDASSTELGVKFRSDIDGSINGLRFYKFAANTGTHVGSLWTLNGSLMGRVTFSGESASGWQFANFASPIAITANTTYVASYLAPVGRYAGDTNYFNGKGAGTGHVKALADGVAGANGVYGYGSSPLFPTLAWMSANYYVDVFFTPAQVNDTTPPTVSGLTPASGATGVATSSVVSATFSEAINQNTLVFAVKDSLNNTVAGSVSYNSSTRVATFNPAAALLKGVTYTASIQASDAKGNAMASATAWSFTTVQPDLTPPTVTSVTPASGATNVSITTALTAVFSEDVNPATIVFSVGGVSGSTSYNAATRTATFTPSAALAYSTAYNAGVTASDTAGNSMASPVAWSFTTVAKPTALTLFADSVVPANPSENDSSPVNVGVKFKSDIAGYITGIRFYKGAGNTGTHIGNLWNSGGTKLAEITFINETATGWQTMKFSNPVAITANTVYVASYFAPKAHYAEDDNYFASAGVDNGTLHALKNGVSGGNGVYRYAGSVRFPSASFASANYYVDVTFSTTASGNAQTQNVVMQTAPATSLEVGSAMSLIGDQKDPLLA